MDLSTKKFYVKPEVFLIGKQRDTAEAKANVGTNEQTFDSCDWFGHRLTSKTNAAACNNSGGQWIHHHTGPAS